MKYNRGDKLQIHCYKHNGVINSISDEAIVLDVTDEFLVCGNYKAKLIDNEGKSHRTKEPAIIFFYKKLLTNRRTSAIISIVVKRYCVMVARQILILFVGVRVPIPLRKKK